MEDVEMATRGVDNSCEKYDCERQKREGHRCAWGGGKGMGLPEDFYLLVRRGQVWEAP